LSFEELILKRFNEVSGILECFEALSRFLIVMSFLDKLSQGCSQIRALLKLLELSELLKAYNKLSELLKAYNKLSEL
jgi:hypothetical protein